MDKRELIRAAFERAMAEAEAKEAEAAGKTVRELWDAWYPTVAATGRGPNIKAHRKHIDRMECRSAGEKFVLGDLAWVRCDPTTLNAWMEALRSYVSRFGKPLEPSTRDQVRLSLQACFTYHVKTRTIGHNPLSGIPREPNRVRRREGFFTPQQLEQFLAHCRPVVAAILRTSVRCGGLRNSEVRLLRKSQIDHESREFVVVNKGRNGIKKTKRVLITDDIYDLIRAWSTTSPGEFVFAHPMSRHGGPIPKTTFNNWMTDAATSSGVVLFNDEKPVMHHARHTWTMSMLDKGVPDRRIADQLGHASTAMLAHYGALRGKEAKEELRKAMNALPGRAAAHRYPCPVCHAEYAGPRAAADCEDSHSVPTPTDPERELRKGPHVIQAALITHSKKVK